MHGTDKIKFENFHIYSWSYHFGYLCIRCLKNVKPEKLWGGIPESWRKFNVTCMFISAAGFTIMWWMFLFQWENQAVDTFLGHGNQIVKEDITDYSFVLVW